MINIVNPICDSELSGKYATLHEATFVNIRSLKPSEWMHRVITFSWRELTLKLSAFSFDLSSATTSLNDYITSKRLLKYAPQREFAVSITYVHFIQMSPLKYVLFLIWIHLLPICSWCVFICCRCWFCLFVCLFLFVCFFVCFFFFYNPTVGKCLSIPFIISTFCITNYIV